MALAWLRSRPGVVIPMLGATKEAQLLDNLGSLDVRLDDSQLARLDEVSRIELGFPHDFLRLENVTQIVYGDRWRDVEDRRSSVRRTVNDVVEAQPRGVTVP